MHWRLPWCSAKCMEQRGHVKTFAMLSLLLDLYNNKGSKSNLLWKLQRHLTSFHSRNDLYSHSPEPTDHGNWKRSPRGAVWLQTRVQHHGHDFVIRQVQEKCIEQSKALFSVFIKSIWQRYLIQSTGRPSGWSWRDMAAQRSLWGWSSFLMMEWQDN